MVVNGFDPLNGEGEKSGRELLLCLKEVAGSQSAHQLIIHIQGYEGYRIRLIPTNHEFIRFDDIYCLTEWRNRYPNAFLTNFYATVKQTHSWLIESVHKDDCRMLFMLENSQCQQVGYLGIGFIHWDNYYGEADSIVSGGKSPKGLMTEALKTLLCWARKKLLLTDIGVRVLSDNPALCFYHKMGFVEIKRVPLKRMDVKSIDSWVEDDSISFSSRYLVYHKWRESGL